MISNQIQVQNENENNIIINESLQNKPKNLDIIKRITRNKYSFDNLIFPFCLKEDTNSINSDFKNLKNLLNFEFDDNNLHNMKRNYGVYLFGGYDSNNDFYDNEIRQLKFSLKSKKLTFKKINLKTNYKPIPRIGHSLDFHVVSQILILYGGKSIKNEYINQLDVYFIHSKYWQSVTIENNFLNMKRAFHSTSTQDNCLYIFGGINENGFLPSEILQVDLSTPSFILKPKLLI